MPTRPPSETRLRIRAAVALLLALAPAPAAACTATGGVLRCAPGPVFDSTSRLGPLDRQDIDARIGSPGPAVVDEVTRDLSRTWERVRSRSRPPAVVDPAGPLQRGRTGDRP